MLPGILPGRGLAVAARRTLHSCCRSVPGGDERPVSGGHGRWHDRRRPGGIRQRRRDGGRGLLSAAVLGGAFAWACPMAYLLITEVPLTAGWTTPLVWTARPSNDLGAALCATLVLAAGTAVIPVPGRR